MTSLHTAIKAAVNFQLVYSSHHVRLLTFNLCRRANTEAKSSSPGNLQAHVAVSICEYIFFLYKKDTPVCSHRFRKTQGSLITVRGIGSRLGHRCIRPVLILNMASPATGVSPYVIYFSVQAMVVILFNHCIHTVKYVVFISWI